MSYSGTLVYFPASTTFVAVRDALAAQVSSLTATAGQLLATFDNDKVVRVAHDTAPHVPEEARELAARAESAVAAVLARATHRFEITPHEPGVDADDVYNELLRVFDVLRALPDAVGMDPFDGQLYLDNPATTAAKPPTKARAERPAKPKPTPKAKTKAKKAAPRAKATKAAPRAKATKAAPRAKATNAAPRAKASKKAAPRAKRTKTTRR